MKYTLTSVAKVFALGLFIGTLFAGGTVAILGLADALVPRANGQGNPGESVSTAGASSPFALDNVVFPLRYSGNARYLVDQNGVPFPIMGRTSWFVTALTTNDYRTFIDDTVARGYSAIEFHVINHDPRGSHPPLNGNGDAPFLNRLDGSSWNGVIGGSSPDFTTPNEAFWSFADGLLSYCQSKGILVFMFPAYVGFMGGDQGWMQEIVANGPTKMQTYGAWIANRYRNQKNIVWMMGGDMGTSPNSFNQAQTAAENGLLTGLKSVSGQQSTLFCAEWDSESIATDQVDFGNQMTLSGAYSHGGDVNTQGRRAYAHTPVQPAFLLEGPYDQEGPDGNNWNTQATQPVRRFEWWSWLSTIGGYVVGNGYVWPFNAPDWQNHLDSQCTRDLTLLNAFMGSLRWYDLIPSGLGGMRTLIAAGNVAVSSSGYVAASATQDGALLIAYIPPDHSGAITVDMSAMSGPTRARWFDPTSATYTSIGTGLANSGTRVFNPPGNNSAGNDDWVLVLDLGSGGATPTPGATPIPTPTVAPTPPPTATPTGTTAPTPTPGPTGTPGSGLVAAYGFNEGSGNTVTDATGHGLTGIINGATWTTGGRYGGALRFDGSSSYVDLGNPAALQLTGSMTVSAWVRADADPGNDGEIIAKSDTASGWQLKMTPDSGADTFAARVSNAGTGTVHRYGATATSLGVWYHVAGVYDSAARTLNVYVNGLLNNGGLNGTVPSTQANAAVNVNIGRRTGGFYFNGLIDEVRIYNRALSQSEIQGDMNTPVNGAAATATPVATPVPTATIAPTQAPTPVATVTPTPIPTAPPNPSPAAGLVAAYGFEEGSGSTANDSSGNGIDGSIQGAVWTTSGRYGKALSFNGSSGFVDLGNPPELQITGSMTWSAWVYATANPADDGQIIAKSDNFSGWQSKSSEDSGPQTFGIAISDGVNPRVQRYSTTVRSLNIWYHVAGVYDSAARTLDIYINGVRDNGLLRGTVPASQASPAVNVNIGRRTGGLYFSGIIDEVRIYNRALTTTEIQSDMNRPIAGN